jgi:HEAT repeat protein
MESMARVLLTDARSSPVSLAAASESNRGLLKALLDSPKPGLRALGVFALGYRDDAESAASVEKTLKDPNPWIRRAAVQSVARQVREQKPLEKRLGPFLADRDTGVCRMAALGLLLPEVREAAELRGELARFQFGKVSTWASSTYSSTDRPLAPLSYVPPFVVEARKRLAAVKGEDEADLIPALVLLLAQYGDRSGVRRLAAIRSGADRLPDDLMAAITLSQDPTYLPLVVGMVAKATSTWELRKLLQAVRGMSGPEVREFRREVNRRLRELGS